MLAPLLGLVLAAGQPMVLNDNGGWCWYQDPRALLEGDRLLFSSVAHRRGNDGAARHGAVEATAVDLRTGMATVRVLHQFAAADDHNVAALVHLPDDRYLALYTAHSGERVIRYRTSRPGDPTVWDEPREIQRDERVCYSNVFFLAGENDSRGRLYNGYRGEGWDPNLVASDDRGESWRYLGPLLYNAGDIRNRIRPYLKYASDGLRTLHFVATEGHPHERPETSIYHGFLRDGAICASDGTVLGRLADGPVTPESLTRIYDGSPSAKAWTCDLHLDQAGRPYTAYTVHHSDSDLRYRYARWDGTTWQDYPLAYGGAALYATQEHYTGLIALDPRDPFHVVISTNVDPRNGEPRLSLADQKPHYELYEGYSDDAGAHWSWMAITRDSRVDNLRPIIPDGDGPWHVVLWLRGTLTSYTDYDLDVVGRLTPRPRSAAVATPPAPPRPSRPRPRAARFRIRP